MNKKNSFKIIAVKSTDMLQTFCEDNDDVYLSKIVAPEFIKDDNWSMYKICHDADSWLFDSKQLWYKAFTANKDSNDGFTYLVSFKLSNINHFEIVTNFIDKHFISRSLVCEFKIYESKIVKIMVSSRVLVKGRFDVEFGDVVSDLI